ncbi:MAG: hypothetical protein WC699_18315 [Bacteroidales bacterium]|jgi:hypothetical protein
MKRIFPILVLSGMILFYSGCQKDEFGVDDLELGLSNNFMKTYVTVVFEDASTGEMVAPAGIDKIEVSFAGSDQSLTMTPGGKRKNQFSTATGTIELNLDPYAKVPSIDQPVQLVLQATYPGYLPATRQIRITNEGQHRIYVSMVKPDDLPSGVTSVRVDDFAGATGGKIDAAVEQTLGTTGAKIELAEGVVLRTAGGIPLEGPLSLETRFYDTRVVNTSDLLPGGINGNFKQADGTVVDVFMVPGAWMDIEITDKQGNVASQVGSGLIGLTLPVNPQMYNPLTQQAIKEGDKLQLMSFDPANGRWQGEGEATYGIAGVKVGLQHLSTWGLGLTTEHSNVQINLRSADYDALLLRYNFNLTEADFKIEITVPNDVFNPPFIDFTLNEGSSQSSTSLPPGTYSVALSFKNPSTQSIFKLPEPKTITVAGSETTQVDFDLAVVDQFTILHGLLSYALTKDNMTVYGENVTFRFRESGTTEWRKITTGSGGWMTILMKQGSYESQVSKDGKWEPETPEVVEVNGEKHLFTISRTAGTGEPLKSGDPGSSSRFALTNEEKVAQGESIARRASQLNERLSKMLDGARREKDIMRANCLSRKLTELNSNLRYIEGRNRALRDAVSGNDQARANHEYTVLGVLAQKLDQLDQEASQCLGQDIYESGASQVVTTFDTNDANLAFIQGPFQTQTRTLSPIIITTADGKAKIAFEGVPEAPIGWVRK